MMPEEVLQQLVDDLRNMRARVSEHMTNALFEIDRAISAIQQGIEDIEDAKQ